MAHRHPFRSPPPPAVGFAFLAVLGVMAYPLLLDAALARFGVRLVAGALLASGAIGLTWRWRSMTIPALRSTQLVILVLLAAASFRADATALRFVPAVIQAGLAAGFVATLRDEDSVVERMAHFMQPYLPDWVRPYCRVVTGLWAVFFLGNAVAIAALVVSGQIEAWRSWTGIGLYVTAMVLQGIEAVFRKSWFRAFDEGPIDRVFRAIFPPERTERGRRSLEYIRAMRIELGMDES